MSIILQYRENLMYTEVIVRYHAIYNRNGEHFVQIRILDCFLQQKQV